MLELGLDLGLVLGLRVRGSIWVRCIALLSLRDKVSHRFRALFMHCYG